MALYEYTAKDPTGKTIKGNIEAENRKAVLDKMHTDGLVIISLLEKKAEKKSVLPSFGQKKVSVDDVVVFSRQLATMVDAGIPIVGTLDILSQQTTSKAFKDILIKVKDDIDSGLSLSAAFAKHPKVFANLYVSMVRAGESSGMLAEILDRLAQYYEKMAALQRKIKSALAYPAIVTCMAIGITILMLVKVVPVFKTVFSGFGAALPTPTLILIMISDIVRKYFIFDVAVLFVLVIILKKYISTEKGRFQFDKTLLRLPIIGVLFTKVAVSKFTRTLSTLVKSGVPILASLEVVSKTCGNKVFEKAVDSVRFAIREGENIATPLEKSGVFPPMVVRMIGVGEKTGQLEKMLSKVADFYDEQVEATVSALTTLIEPLVIAFLGIVIGGIVICMFMPIFKLTTIINM